MTKIKRQTWAHLLLLLFLATKSTATPMRRQHATDDASNVNDPCAHKSIAELIRTSPVIVKALGARIFNEDDDLNSLSHGGVIWRHTIPSSSSSASSSGSKSATQTAKNMKRIKMATATTKMAASASAKVASILITLTPETIYKGASLLKMTPGNDAVGASMGGEYGMGGGGAGGMFHSSSSGSSSSGSSSSSSSVGNGAIGSGSSYNAESAYQYEGQLNATLEPLACFDSNMLKMLPMELIAFGKLMPETQDEQKQQQQRQQQRLQQQETTATGTSSSSSSSMENIAAAIEGEASASEHTNNRDILHISINGLHRWTPQFEHHIWKHLGWDDWSDFTLCSVTCGKGVQQRFRRCLLDNPMVNMNMNTNLNNSGEDDDDDDDVDEVDEDNMNNIELEVNAMDENELVNLTTYKISSLKRAATVTMTAEATPRTTDVDDADDENNMLHKLQQTAAMSTMTMSTTRTYVSELQNSKEPTWLETDMNKEGKKNENENDDINEHKSVTFVQHNGSNDDNHGGVGGSSSKSILATSLKEHNQQEQQKKHKKHKSAKSLSTLFCEGYNIEQRNCNTFECSDDISDLMKFYKKLPMTDESAMASAVSSFASTSTAAVASSPTSASASSSITTAAAAAYSDFGYSSASASAPVSFVTNATVSNVMQQPSSTPANMGYIRNWRNALNFTLMITLRSKNDTKSTATIFSIRNATHNLYLEACKDGLRLYLERDNTTEMLPLKFNLYDYRWHQVAISIQNGDFISIYVDCSWTNSFVVSKRLYSLPLDADVEIGRNFNGELQQLLVLPENEERQQCSNKRTSINEVKRYIIDTFIDDYAN